MLTKDDALLYISQGKYIWFPVQLATTDFVVLFHCTVNLAKCICSENPALPEHFMSIFYGLSTRFSKANQSDCETEPSFLSAVLGGGLFHAKYNFPSHIFHRIVLRGEGEPKILLFIQK